MDQKTLLRKNKKIILSKLKVHKRKDGMFQCNIYLGNIDGKRVLDSYYASNKDILYDKIKANYNNTLQGIKTKQCKLNSNPIFREYCLYWLNYHKQPTVKPSTLDRLLKTSNLVIDYIGNELLSDITYEMLQNVLYDVAKRGYSKSTIKKVKQLFNQIFKFAIRDKLVTENPTLYLELPKEQRTNPDTKKYFTVEEIKRMKEVAKIPDQYTDGYLYKYGYIFLFMANTGIRKGEMLALKWSDVDFERHIMRINKTISRCAGKDDIIIYKDDGRVKHKNPVIDRVSDTTKTESSNRTAILTEDAEKYLLLYKEKYYSGPNSYILYGKTAEHLSYSSFDKRFQVFKHACGIYEPCGLHTLRHTFATYAFTKWDIKTLSKTLGHSSTSVTTDIYVSLAEDVNYNKRIRQLGSGIESYFYD